MFKVKEGVRVGATDVIDANGNLLTLAANSTLFAGLAASAFAPAVSNWTPVTATGTGASQTIALPQSGLATKDVLVSVEGLIQDPGDYSIAGTILTITAPNTANVTIRKINAGTAVTTNDPLPVRSMNPQTASYTVVLGDSNTYIRMNVASPNNVTIPPESAVAFPIGTEIVVASINTGQTTIVAGSGVVINTPESLKLRKRYSGCTLIKVASNEWDIVGDLELV